MDARVEKMISEKECVEKVESCIKKLKEQFIQYRQWGENEREMLSFFGEKYLHYKLYRNLKQNLKQCEIRGGHPTKQRYRIIKEKLVNDGTLASFDLAILGSKENTPFVAIEFSFDLETDKPIKRSLNYGSFKNHFNRDFKKLTDKGNKVTHAYILSFIKASGKRTDKKEKAYQYHKKECKRYLKEKYEKYIEEKNEQHPDLKILFVEVDELSGKSDIAPYPEGWLK